MYRTYGGTETQTSSGYLEGGFVTIGYIKFGLMKYFVTALDKKIAVLRYENLFLNFLNSYRMPGLSRASQL